MLFRAPHFTAKLNAVVAHVAVFRGRISKVLLRNLPERSLFDFLGRFAAC